MRERLHPVQIKLRKGRNPAKKHHELSAAACNELLARIGSNHEAAGIVKAFRDAEASHPIDLSTTERGLLRRKIEAWFPNGPQTQIERELWAFRSALAYD